MENEELVKYWQKTSAEYKVDKKMATTDIKRQIAPILQMLPL